MTYMIAPPPEVIEVIASAAGKVQISDNSEDLGSSRVWLLPDHTVHVATSDRVTGQLVRRVFNVTTAHISRGFGIFNLEDGRQLSLVVKACGCGLGVAGSAGIVDSTYNLVMIQRPEWVTAD